MILKYARWRVDTAIRPCCCAKSGSMMTVHSKVPRLQRGERSVASPWAGTVLTLALVGMVADQGRYLPGASNTSVVVRSELVDAIREARDLRGRRVDASVRGAPHDYILFKLLEQGGLSPSDLDVAYLTNMENGLLALRNQSIDAAVLQEPGPAFAEAEGFGRRWLTADQII